MHPLERRSSDSARRAAYAVALVALGAGCGTQQGPTLFPITLRVMNDSRPMPGAQIVIRDRAQGTTDAQGSFRMRMTGVEGATVPVTVRCPNGFVSPTEPVNVTLRSAIAIDRNAHTGGIETTVQCPPDQRVAAVIVRTPNRANLPVFYQGREITRTDLQGVAHMIFKVRPRDVLVFRIDTTAQPQLRPANPSFNVATREGDDVYVSTLNFEDAPAPRAARRVVAPSVPTIRRIPPSRHVGGGFF